MEAEVLQGCANVAIRLVKVVIVGAGISGLTAAQRLLKYNPSFPDLMDINIFEATDRIGGRIHTYQIGKGHAEYGATWMHGCSKENPLYDIALTHNLGPVVEEVPKFVSSNIEQSTESGKSVPLQLRERVQEIFYKLMDDSCSVGLSRSSTVDKNRCKERSMDDGTDDVDHDHKESLQSVKSVGEFVYGSLTGVLKEETLTLNGIESPILRSILQQLATEELINNGCHSLYSLNRTQYDIYQDIAGGDFHFPKGYTSLVDTILENISLDRIHLNHPVAKIEWDRGISIHQQGDHSPVRVHFQNGEMVDADIVLVTSSLGYLKYNTTDFFEPALPDDKLHAIHNLGFGTVNKIHLQYNAPFWQENWKGLRLLWDCDSLANLEGDWSVKDEWYKRVSSIRTSQYNPDVLEMLLSGEEAKYIEGLDLVEIGKVLTDVLQKFLCNPAIPEPSKVAKSSWFSHPYIRGSYSYISTESTSDDIVALAEPVTVTDSENIAWPRICFAGEATSKYYYSTVHGALLSGRREADRISSFVQSLTQVERTPNEEKMITTSTHS